MPRATVPLGYAIYGVGHDRIHAELEAGRPVQIWYAPRCCMGYADFYPSISQLRYWMPFADIQDIAATYPGRTWLIWNEPDVPNQADIDPIQAIPITREWVTIIRDHGGQIAGYGVTVVHSSHWLKDRWKTWLQEWTDLGGPMPDYAHVHIYAGTPQEWDDLWGRWDDWNSANWNLPTILSEVGQGPAVAAHLRELVNPKIVRMHWFTNFTDNPIDGIP